MSLKVTKSFQSESVSTLRQLSSVQANIERIYFIIYFRWIQNIERNDSLSVFLCNWATKKSFCGSTPHSRPVCWGLHVWQRTTPQTALVHVPLARVITVQFSTFCQNCTLVNDFISSCLNLDFFIFYFWRLHF